MFTWKFGINFSLTFSIQEIRLGTGLPILTDRKWCVTFDLPSFCKCKIAAFDEVIKRAVKKGTMENLKSS